VNETIEKETAFDKLSDKHKLFVKNYIKHFSNGTKAYLDTYPGASYDTARAQSAILIAKHSIKQAIDEEYSQVYADIRSETEKAETYNLIKAIGESDISQIIEIEDGSPKIKNLSEIPIEALHSIQSIEGSKVKLHPKLKALELRAKIQGLIDSKDEAPQVNITIKPAKEPEDMVEVEEE
jgi:phage terminase small subunit